MAETVDNALILRCNEVEKFTERAATDGNLLGTLESVGRLVRSYAFKSRFKTPNDILKKINRKRREGRTLIKRLEIERRQLREKSDRTPEDDARLRKIRKEMAHAHETRDYGPEHITDAWGCRFVTLYQSEIPTTVSALLSALHAFNEGNHGTTQVRLKEFVIYTNRPEQDPLSIVSATREALERSGFKDHATTIREPENRKSAYSSVHLVFDRDILIEHAGKHPGNELAKFEIQIRDIFEEGWGEVQHHLLYSDKEEASEAGTWTETEEERAWRLHLNALKTFVDGCSQHASIIRRHFDESKRAPIALHSTQSVTNRVEDHRLVSQELKRVGAQEKTIEAISNGYTLLKAGEEATVPKDKLTRYGEASRAFEAALASLGRSAKRNPEIAGRSVRYYLSMEFANCRMAIADAYARLKRPQPKRERSCHDDARRVYSEMASLYPADPVANIRWGKALEKLAKDDTGLREAQNVIERGISLLADDPITGLDHWIAITSHIDKGIVLWRMAQNQPPDEHAPEALDLIMLAAAANLDALDVWQSQPETTRLEDDNRMGAHKAASNMLFFGGKLIEDGRVDNRINAGALRAHIDFIKGLKIETHADYYKTRDNFLHAYRALGEEKQARALAETNFCELRDLAEARSGNPLDIGAVERHLRGSEARCFRTARRYLFPEGG